ncbi:MAG TPA: gephyrin-like molybdotransferase Glp [Chloroflexota bacterium]
MARQAELLSVEEARGRILAAFHRLESKTVPSEESLGRVLADDLRAGFDLPPFANSSMDGFALASESTAGASSNRPAALRVASHIPAGSSTSIRVSRGETARIMTGAPLPPGTDAVVPFEEVEDRGDSIIVGAPVSGGSCVRAAGQDVRSGFVVLTAGTELTSRHIGLLAALGCPMVSVVRRPAVAILSTGDELVSPGLPLNAGQIYNSNSPMLAAAVVEAGGTPRVLSVVRDDPRELTAAVDSAAGSDLLLTSGGASVGDFDYVKDVVGDSGELSFWRVRVRPGKPLLFGSIQSTRVIGLPGNPTSSMVTFEEFVRPAIRYMLGAPTTRATIRVVLDDRIDNRGGRRTYARALLRYDGERFHAQLSGPQDSAMLLPLAHADGLVVVPEDRDELAAGEEALMQIWRLADTS